LIGSENDISKLNLYNLIFETEFQNLIYVLLIQSCCGTDMLKKNGTSYVITVTVLDAPISS